jgi:hypothetical protein
MQRGRPLLSYRVTWRRAGEIDTFIHGVIANHSDEARQHSIKEIQQALGPNAGFWLIEGVQPCDPPRVSAAGTLRRRLIAILRWCVGLPQQPAQPDTHQGVSS